MTTQLAPTLEDQAFEIEGDVQELVDLQGCKLVHLEDAIKVRDALVAALKEITEYVAVNEMVGCGVFSIPSTKMKAIAHAALKKAAAL